MPTIEQRPLVSELTAIALGLNRDELRVLVMLAGRLAAGRVTHGPMNVVGDPRDFTRERAEELSDALVYTCMAELKRVAGGGA